MIFLRILSFLFLIPGIAMVFAARWIVKKYELDRNVQCDFEDELSEKDLNEYKNNKAIINVKLTGMLIALPGFILAIISFR